MTNQIEEKRLADYLPYEYRKKAENGEESDTLKFLKAFDRILLGLPKENPALNPTGNTKEISALNNIEGLEDKIARMADFFNPDKTPLEFLPWLSQWVALMLRVDIKEETQRKFIEKIVSLYQMRGTKDNMAGLLALFIRQDVTKVSVVSIKESDIEPHFFKVMVNLNDVKDGDKKEDYDRAVQQAHSIIHLAKPAHTCYQLIPQFDTFRIGPYNTCPTDQNNKDNNCPIVLGGNTRLGMANWKTIIK